MLVAVVTFIYFKEAFYTAPLSMQDTYATPAYKKPSNAFEVWCWDVEVTPS